MKSEIKKSLSIFLTIILLLSVIIAAPIQASALSVGDVVGWMSSKNGTTINDGGTQCVAAFNSYLRLFGFSNPIGMYPVSGAKDIFDYDAPSGWQKIWGSGNYRVGDVVIWDGSVGRGWGHVGMVYSTNNGVEIFDQNWVTKNVCGIHSLSSTGAIRGVFRPPLGDNIFPGDEDTSWNVPVWKTANYQLNTYDTYGIQESNRWIDAGDNCYIEKVYQNGYAWVKYPSSASSDGYRWAFTRADGFNLEPKGNNPIGHVDNVSGEVGKVHITGWAFDSDDIGAQLNIHVYIGGSCGDSNAEGHGDIWANVERTDVNNVYGCGNHHGFDANIHTSKTGTQPVYIYAINVGSGTDNPCIGSGTVNITADTGAPDMSEVTVSQISEKGYRVSCKVTDESGISHVSMPTWTHKDGQDDLIWHDATISGEYASYYVSVNDHNNETGTYTTHIYAYDTFGNCSQSGSFSSNIEIVNEPKEVASVTAESRNRYVVFNSGKSWAEAKEWCEQQGGHLATISNEPEWEVVKNVLEEFNGTRCWLGAERVNGSFKWIDDTEFSYNLWEENQPDNAGGIENYLGTWNKSKMLDCYKWNDYTNNATDVGGFVCEFDAEPIEVVTINTNNGHIYVVYDSRISWTKAKNWCEQQGGHLATITNETEWETVRSGLEEFNGARCWLGAKRENGSFKWIDNTEFNYIRWADNQPDNAGGIENYLGTWDSSSTINCYEWNDYTCNATDICGFVCEFENEHSTLKGDINNDGKVNMKDLVLLQQYLNNWEVTIDENAANVNGDSKINMKDLVLLQQFLNNWDVVLV